MTEKRADERYLVDVVHAKSLEGNPIHSPVDRELHVYLPPGYFESEKKRYPVVYFLHGYNGNSKKITVVSSIEGNKSIPLELIPPDILKQIDLDRMPSYVKFDEMIASGESAPFVFVQPDGSLHLPYKDGAKDFTGLAETKGSFYLNSPSTGNFADYIVKDIIDHVDANYRTIPDKQHRGLVGGSMGGYGVLSICLHHPEIFIASAALSPGNNTIDSLDWKLVTPIYEMLLGKELAEKNRASIWNDVWDTQDLLFSKDNPLLPSVKRDDNGRTIDFNREAAKNWEKYDINYVIRTNPDALRKVRLLLYCDGDDEYRLNAETKKIHDTLAEIGIDHRFEMHTDPKAALSPHILGAAYTIIPGIRFCLQHFTENQK